MLFKEQPDGDDAAQRAHEAGRRRRHGAHGRVRRRRPRPRGRRHDRPAARRGAAGGPRRGRAPRGRGPAVSARRPRAGGPRRRPRRREAGRARPRTTSSALVRRLSRTRRVGHGGTLDPFAAGVLPVFLGRATRLVEYHLGATKRYRATICFGATSTTDDIDGERTPVDGPPVTRGPPSRRRSPRSRGRSARGRPTTARSRSRAAAPTRWRAPASRSSSRRATSTIHALDARRVGRRGPGPARSPSSTSSARRARTSARSPATSASALGSGAYLGALVRTASGGFRLEDAVSLETSGRRGRRAGGVRSALLRPVDAGLEDLPARRDHRRRDPPPRRGPVDRPEDAARRPRRAGRARGRPGRARRRGVPRGGGALHPHKVLVDAAAAPAGARAGRGLTVESSRASSG